MNQKAIIITLIAIALISLPSAMAFSNEHFEIKNATNVNGSIGLNIYNKYDRMIYADSSHHDYVFTFYLTENGSEIPILEDLSDTRIASHETSLVVLDTTWPSSNYKKIKIDLNGENDVYASESYYVFAEPGFKVEETSVEPTIPVVTKTVYFILDVKAIGDADITNLAIDAEDPYLYSTGDITAPTTIGAGEEAQIKIAYLPKMSSGFGSISYKEIKINLTINYKYHSKPQSYRIDEAIYVYDPDEADDKPPIMDAKLALDSTTLAKGSSSDLEVYVWNDNLAGGHSACNVSTTITPSDNSITIKPSPTILHSSKSFPSGSSQPASSTATYTVEIADNTPAGTYSLELAVKYKDCAWPTTGTVKKTINLTIEGGNIVVPVEDDTAEEPGNATPEKVIELIEDEPPAQPPREIPASYIILAAVIGVVGAVFGGYFVLKAMRKIM